MPSRAPFGVGVLRTAAQQLANQGSIRAAADEIGVSYTALRWFLRGGKPQQATRTRLIAWYSGRGKSMGAVEISEDVKSAISLLAYHIGVAATPAVARRRTISTIDAWLAELSAAERGRVIPALVEHLLSLHGVSSKRKTEF